MTLVYWGAIIFLVVLYLRALQKQKKTDALYHADVVFFKDLLEDNKVEFEYWKKRLADSDQGNAELADSYEQDFISFEETIKAHEATIEFQEGVIRDHEELIKHHNETCLPNVPGC